jgi:hypothetical protein
VFNIVAPKNVDVDVNADACFMVEVVEITAGDMYALCKDERRMEGKREFCVL